jgi:hypothetical protein
MHQLPCARPAISTHQLKHSKSVPIATGIGDTDRNSNPGRYNDTYSDAGCNCHAYREANLDLDEDHYADSALDS